MPIGERVANLHHGMQRQKLWNEVEKIEIRKNAQLGRELNIALPVELDFEKQKELI